jgi:hypothetical protein
MLSSSTLDPGLSTRKSCSTGTAAGHRLDARRQEEYWRVPYPFATTEQRMEEAGVPDSLVQRLSFGH